MVLHLYAAPLSTASARVAQVLREKKVPFEFHPIDLSKKEQKTEEYLAKQPFGQVPYIDDDGFILYESRAIARYIARKYADQGTPNLIPDFNDLQAWALFEQAYSNEVANFENFAVKIVLEKIFKPRLGQEPDLVALENARKQLGEKLDVYEKILSDRPYLTGDNVTIVDLSHIPFGNRLFQAGSGDLIESRPHVNQWWQSIVNRESWTAIKNGIQSYYGE